VVSYLGYYKTVTAGTSPTKVWFPAISMLTAPYVYGSAAHLLMITLPTDFCNPISQDIYDELLSTLQFHQLSCTCGLSGSLKVHGYYLRRLKNGPFSIMLRICRVKCSCCGRTHALLPDIIVPYSQISLPDQASIISSFEAGRSFQHVMERCPSIDENNVYSVLRRYLRFWRQRLLAESISLHSFSALPARCLDAFARQFMQIKCTPNLLFFKTT
jgi:hypothetical protein